MNAKGSPVLSTAELSAAKKVLLEKRLQGTGRRSSSQLVIQKTPRTAHLPLSFAQQRLWFLDQLAPGNPVYNIFEALRIKGPLNVRCLEKSLAEIVNRHEALRTTFGIVDGQPVQIINRDVSFELSEIDLYPLPPQKQEESARRLACEEAARPFDLTKDLMLRGTLLHLDGEDHVLLMTMHHIASDGWSIGVLFRELSQLYNATVNGSPPPLPELPLQYADYAVWQRQSLTGPVLEKQVSYWKEQLAGAPEILELPTDRPRPAVQTFRGASQFATVPLALTRGLTGLGRQEGVTLYMTLLAAFGTLLHRYTRQSDIVIGSPIAGRTQTATEGLIGFFINTLALRTDLSGDPTFRELLQRTRKVTLDAYAHQDVPFDKLVVELQPERSSSHTPLFQVMFALQSAPPQPLELIGLTIMPMTGDNGTAKFDLTLAVSEVEHGLVLDLEYNQDLFDEPTIGRMLGHFQILLEAIVAHPEQRISELPIMSAAERHQLVVEWNQTDSDYPRETPVHTLFEQQAACTPEAIALQYERQILTYRELNTRANQLAHHLISLGVPAGACVGVYLDRTPELFVALLAILKAGAAYLPLDRSYPKDRIAFMLEDAKVPLLVSDKRFASELPTSATRTIYLEQEARQIARQSGSNPTIPTNGESLAYVIYTSGSTGRPKGACIPHRAINRLVINSDYVRFGPNEVVAQASNVSFDAATFEIWGALLNGGRLVLMTKEVVLSPKEFAEQLKKQRITTLFLTTSLFNLMAREVPGAFATLTNVVYGGEAADPRWVGEVLRHQPPRRVVNGYGPTETATFAAWFCSESVPEGARSIPIGRPLANTRLYILDEHRQPVPTGVPGELYIGGDGVGLGYLNRAELTADRFVRDHFTTDPNACLYKTGDLVRYLPDGNIEFLGRIDLQVKIRGFRIEIGEIETLLGQHPSISECAVTIREDIPGDKRLVAYYVPHPEPNLSVEALREYLKRGLPEYMVPSAFVRLVSLPINPNGKVNRRALPAPDPSSETSEVKVAPRDSIEERLVVIWESVLHVRPIGIKDRFFHLGGHSLLAVKLVSEIEKAFGQKLSVSSVFRAPTVEQLATMLRGGELASAVSSIVDLQPHGNKPPLFLVHGVGGGMFWGYQNLSRHLGSDQPVYVIRSRAMDGDGREEFKSIGEMAAHYVADLRAFQSKGPYYLGGYCFGGNVAYEMSRQLSAQGEQVAFVALMNCAPPNSSYTRFRWTPTVLFRFLVNIGFWIGNIWNWTRQQRRDFVRWKLRTAGRRLAEAFGRSVTRPEHGDVDEIVDLSSYTEEQRKLWAAHVQALIDYHPDPFPGRVTLYRSRVHQFLCSFDSACGWRELAKGGVSVKVVPGPHEGILEEPHVRALAAELKDGLEATQKQHGSTPPPPTKPKIEPIPNTQPSPPSSKMAELSFAQQQAALGGRTELSLSVQANLEPLMDDPHPARKSGRRKVEFFELPEKLFQAVKRLSQREGVTTSLILLAAFGILVARTIRDEHLPVRLSVSYRGRPQIQHVIRRFADVAETQMGLTSGASVRKVLKTIQKAVQAALEQVRAPLRNLADDLFSDSSPGDDDAVENSIEFSSVGAHEAEGALAEPVLQLRVQIQDQHAHAILEYDADHFEEATARRLLSRFEAIISAMTESDPQTVAALPLLTPEERRQLLDWSHTPVDFPLDKSWPELFQQRVLENPDATAVKCGDRELRYSELNETAERFASHLHSMGAGHQVVAVALERSPEFAIATVGILKAGSIYLPLELGSPRDRLAEILADANPALILAHRKFASRLPESGFRIVWLDEPDALTVGTDRGCGGLPDSLDVAYVMYTSGSSGKPKGVLIAHHSLVNHNCAVAKSFDLTASDRVLQFSSLSFDISIEEMFPTWLMGGTVVFRPDDIMNSFHRFLDFVQQESITVLNVPTAFWHELVDFLPIRSLPESVRLVVIGGERAAQRSFDLWQEYAGQTVRLINTYGPTEGAVTTTQYEAHADDRRLPIGRPLANNKVYVLDEDQSLCPVGVAGELYIGGAGLALGYLNRPELTASRFVANPFADAPNERLYKTGDMVRWRGDGHLEFIGRADQQLKIRGFRVEPGEIEAALALHPAIAECAVVPEGNRSGVLAAYFTTRSSRCPAESELRNFVQQRVPEYMVPRHFVALDKLPRTLRGKVDRFALAGMPLDCSGESMFNAPQNSVEAKIEEVWCEVLKLDRVGVDENFLRLGGHSLHAMQVASRLQAVFGEDIAPSDVFECPTIRSLAMGVFGFIRRRKGRAGGPITAISRRQSIPLSFAQQRLWFLQQLDPSTAAYNIPQAIRIEGNLDVTALEGSLTDLVRRHEALRTVFLAVDGRPAQTINPPTQISLSQIDLRKSTSDDARRRVADEARRPFDLSRDSMMRTVLFQVTDQEHLLLLTIHHIAADAWSIGVVIEELKESYRSRTGGHQLCLPELPVQYADFASWQRDWLQGAPLEEQLQYWRQQLAGTPSLLELPADRPRPAVQSSQGARQAIRLDHEVVDKLGRLSEQENSTLFMTLLAAFQSVLNRYTGREDIVVGCPAANRNRPEIERVVGFFVNTLVLRGDLSGDPTFRELLRKTRETAMGAFSHQDLPFEMLVDELQPARDPSYHPLFQVMFVLQNAPAPGPSNDGLSWTPVDIDIGTSKFDLSLELSETNSGLEGWLEYSTDLFDSWRMERMAQHFQTLVGGIADQPDVRVSELPLLTAEDRRIVFDEWQGDKEPLPQDKCIHQLFEAQALRTPDLIAVVFGEKELTYKELNRRADHLAHVLRSLGVGPDALAGICMERSLDMIVAILGVLKAGGAYVPMDPAYPQDRVAFMIEDAQASVLVTQRRLLSRLPAGAMIVTVDDSKPVVVSEGSPGKSQAEFRTPSADNLAYVIYTSGSTGQPKGVAVEHRSAVALLHWARRTFSDQELSGVLFVTSICFDLSIFEMFVPLSCGGKIVLTDNALQWTTMPAARQVSLVNTVPSLAAEWLRAGNLPDSVQTINLAGEPLSQSLVEEIYKRWPQVKKVNDLYGPTETTVYSTGSTRISGQQATIGRPLTNEQVYLLDQKMNFVPIGVPGELYIGGAGLAREYLRRPELTAEKFVKNPFGEGRLYRTGDLARYRRDGAIEYLGRVDHQVKIRGYRIELGEIEERLRQHPQVHEAVVITADSRGGEKRLVAYLAVQSPSPEVADLRALLKQHLPDYMLPATFVVLDALPHTPNGKIDRKALPPPKDSRVSDGKEHVAPATMTEKMLAEIWTAVLGVNNIGANDNFFELGGHSLLITKVLARVREAIDLDLPMRLMFEAPTISELAKAIERALLDEVEQLSEEEAERLDASVKAEEAFEELRA